MPKKVNPWAVCHTTVDKEKDPKKYEDCVMKVKEKNKKAFNLKRYLIAKKEERENSIKGGIGDHLTEKDVDPKQLEMGIKIEKEHSPREDIAKDISFDHLKEDDKYYTHLREMEKKHKKKSFNLKKHLIAKKKENVDYVECPKDCGNSGSMADFFELEREDNKTWVPKKRLKEYNETCKRIKEDLKESFNLKRHLEGKKKKKKKSYEIVEPFKR
jgi:hypothetical protein